jgi:D-alanine-D-alanine ligase
MTRSAARKLRVTVLCGGPGSEREVSLMSGGAVAQALRERGHDVFVSDIRPDDLAALERDADVIFPALHGEFGEDGTLQGIMEQRGLRFVGSRSASCALAMDKLASKQRVAAAGIPTPEYELITRESLMGAAERLALPCVVKPVDQGSSVGAAIHRERAALSAHLQDVVGKFGRALVERFIAGDELTVGFLGDMPLPPICIRPKSAFYDYHAKYEADDTEYLFDAGHGAALLGRARDWSARVFKLLGARHLARVDWIIDADGGLWFLELNSIPGFTSHSLVPKAAAHSGIPFDELVERLVHMAMEDAA